MLTVADALHALLNEAHHLPRVEVDLADALGLTLSDGVSSDSDSPPFDKALMDGFAVRADDVRDAGTRLSVVEEVTAGRTPTRTVGRGEAVRIMTGAPIPNSADAVVKVEDCRFDESAATVELHSSNVEPGANIMRRGASVKRGAELVPAGRTLRPQELAVLAEFGCARVAVHRRPRIAVLATGDELVPPAETPGPGQIRNSNETMLAAQIVHAGAEALPLGIARDEPNHLRERIRAGLECDVLLLSGGVSAGKLDLVPSELEHAGVRQVFHKVNVKPGKPVWFGVFDVKENESNVGRTSSPSEQKCYVFGLPGNPVSSMVCFELFTRPLVRRLMGVEPAESRVVRARLQKEHIARSDRPTYHPARLAFSETGWTVEPVAWQGSADLRATADADAMAVFPAGEREYAIGEMIDAISWD